MHKLSRLHFHECGYVDSYKDSLTIDLRDPRDGQLHDAVLNIENGGGKTGLLSLFFSCFDTELNRYLRTLIRRHERFEQDFGDKPGAIIAEWAMPPATAALVRDDPRRLVTAQIVRPVRRAGADEFERHFFLFRAGPAFHFDALIGTLRHARGAPLARDEIPAWLHRIRAEIKPLQFWDGTHQAHWKERLEQHGLDVELLRMQVDFNRDEGGIDDFLNIRDEREFLLKFLRLTLNAETAESTRSLLQQNIIRLGEHQALRDRQRGLQELREVFCIFATAAAEWASADARLLACRSEAAGLAVALKQERDRERRGESLARDALVQTLLRRQAWEAESRSAAAQLAALAHEQTRRRHESAAQDLKRGEKERSQAAEEVRLWQAAIDHREIIRAQGEVSALTQQIDDAERDLEAPRRQTRTLGSQLHQALGEAVAALNATLGELQAVRSEHESQRKALDGEHQRIRDQTSARTKEKSIAEQFVATHERRYRQLSEATAAGHRLLLDGETGADAVLRWNQLSGQFEETAARLEEENVEAERLQGETANSVSTLEGEIAATRAQLQIERTRYQAALREQDRLASDAVLLRALDESVSGLLDPHAPETMRLVRDRLARLALRLRDAERSAEQCEAAGTAIRRAGLSGIDADAVHVAEALRVRGVRDAQPYARWMAENGRGEAELRAFAQTDPARFGGVYVPAAAQLEKVRELDVPALALSRPVEVSVGRFALQEQSEAITLTPIEASAYSLAAAGDRLRQLEVELDANQRNVESRRSERSSLEEAALRLSRFVDEWGEGRLDALGRQIEVQARELTASEQEAGGLRTLLTELGAAIRQRRLRVQQLHASLAQAQAGWGRVQEFVEECEIPLPARRADLARAQQALEELLEQDQALGRARAELLSAEVALAERKAAVENDRNRLVDERSHIVERADGIVLASQEPVERLRAAYAATLENLRAAEAGRLEGPRGQLKEKKNRLAVQKLAFGKSAAGLSSEEIDVRSARPALEHALSASRAEAERCGERIGELRTRANDAAQTLRTSTQNLSPDAQVALPGLEAETDSQIAERHTQSTSCVQALEDEGRSLTSIAQAQERAIEAHIAGQKELSPWLDAVEPISEGALPGAVRLAVERNEMGEQVRRCVNQHRDAGKALNQYKDAARKKHEAVAARARAPDFARLEPALTAQMSENELEAAAEEAPRLARQLDERIASVESDLSELEADRGRCLDKLVELAKQAEHQIRSAESYGVVPSSVPRFGGQHVLTMKPFWKDVNTALRRHRLDEYIGELARAQRVPEDAANLAAECLVKIAAVVTDRGEGVLGLKILKTNSEGELRHEPIHRLGSSGGERLTSALLLYLVLARLRAESRVSAVTSGGVLVLDNPFGTANKPLFLQMQRSLAQAMDVQLVYTTGILDLNSLAEFKLIVRLRRGRKRGRHTLVEGVRLIDGAIA
jgi:hypothetical protein